MTNTDRILQVINLGPTTQLQLVATLGIEHKKINNLVGGLRDRGVIEKVGTERMGHSARPVSVYALAGEGMPKNTDVIVHSALARRTELERVWK